MGVDNPIWEAVTDEGTPVRLMNLIKGGSGNNLKLSEVDTVKYTVTDLRTGGKSSATLAPGSVLYESPITTDSRYGGGADGYNFAWQAPGTLFPKGNRVYRIEVEIDETLYGAVYAKWDVVTREIHAN